MQNQQKQQTQSMIFPLMTLLTYYSSKEQNNNSK